MALSKKQKIVIGILVGVVIALVAGGILILSSSSSSKKSNPSLMPALKAAIKGSAKGSAVQGSAVQGSAVQGSAVQGSANVTQASSIPSNQIINPTNSGQYYIYSPMYNAYLNITGSKWSFVPSVSNATAVYWDYSSSLIEDNVQSPLVYQGVNIVASAASNNPYSKNLAGVLLSEKGYNGTAFSVQNANGVLSLSGGRSILSSIDKSFMFSFVPVASS